MQSCVEREPWVAKQPFLFQMEEFECASLSGDEEGGKQPELDKERKKER